MKALKQTLLFGFTKVADPDNEKQPMTGHFGQKSGLAKWWFLFYSTVCIKNILPNSIFSLFLEIKKIVCPFQDFQGPRPKFKDFPGPGYFSPIPGLFRISTDRGNLVSSR